ncbi:hypothetical protein [Ancylobacter sp.]|uniref:hypothetical protein n=1 Tax=Ancylobacter sp. TaxID=1872567 RepID=UPI003D12AA9C
MNEAAIRAAIARLTAAPAAGVFEPTPGGSPEPMSPVERLAARVCARQWRRSRVDPQTLADIRAKIAAAIEAGAPLEFAVPFGGYKGALQPSAPELDWAEVFWIGHLRRYAETVAGHHAAGVLFSLSYFHGVLGDINGVPPGDQDRYVAGLRALLARFSDALIAFRLVDLSTQFGGAAGAVAAIDSRFREMRAALADGASVPPLAVHSAARNLARDVSEAVPTAEEIEASALRCAAMESLEERRCFNKYGPRIQITHIRGASLSLHLGSCATSIMQPWVGTGVLESDGQGQWRPRILNGRIAGIDGHLAVRHPLEEVSPALRCVPLRNGGVPG